MSRKEGEENVDGVTETEKGTEEARDRYNGKERKGDRGSKEEGDRQVYTTYKGDSRIAVSPTC